MRSIDEALEKLKVFPEGLFNPEGMDDEEIRDLEHELNVSFPLIFYSFLRRMGRFHGGILPLFRTEGYEIPDRVRRADEEDRDYERKRPPHILPVAEVGEGDYICLGLAHDKEAEDVPVYGWEVDSDKPILLASSFLDWLNRYLERLFDSYNTDGTVRFEFYLSFDNTYDAVSSALEELPDFEWKGPAASDDSSVLERVTRKFARGRFVGTLMERNVGNHPHAYLVASLPHLKSDVPELIDFVGRLEKDGFSFFFGEGHPGPRAQVFFKAGMSREDFTGLLMSNFGKMLVRGGNESLYLFYEDGFLQIYFAFLPVYEGHLWIEAETVDELEHRIGAIEEFFDASSIQYKREENIEP